VLRSNAATSEVDSAQVSETVDHFPSGAPSTPPPAFNSSQLRCA
jgi:hypothetical protein